MKNKVLIFGSIFAALIILTMPAISSINISNAVDSKEEIVVEQLDEKIQKAIDKELNDPQPASLIDIIIGIIRDILRTIFTVLNSLLSLIIEIINVIIPGQ